MSKMDDWNEWDRRLDRELEEAQPSRIPLVPHPVVTFLIEALRLEGVITKEREAKLFDLWSHLAARDRAVSENEVDQR